MQYSVKYVYRMMSKKEYDDLLAGRQLTNETVHDPKHEFSYSVGFCFLPWIVDYAWRVRQYKKTVQVTDKMTALQAIDRLLPGTSKYDIWVQLKVLNPQVLKKSKGRYIDFNTGRIVWAREYCTTTYSAKDLQPMHVFSMPKVLDMLFNRFMAVRSKH